MPLNHATCQLYAAPNTITVPDDYSSIQAAINAANAGDIVYVRNGTYYELVEVNKTISLVGENKDATVIDGNGIPNISVLSIYDVSNATIQDLTVQNGTARLFLGNANYTKLRNISLRSNQQNIILFDPLAFQNTTEDIDESNTVDGKPVYSFDRQGKRANPKRRGLRGADQLQQRDGARTRPHQRRHSTHQREGLSHRKRDHYRNANSLQDHWRK